MYIWYLIAISGLIAWAVITSIRLYKKKFNSNAVQHTSIIHDAHGMLCDLCDEYDIPSSHGPKHAILVLMHAQRAIDTLNISSWPEYRRMSIMLAALLHDADDHKYFSLDSHNAADILDEVLKNSKYPRTIKREALEMISYVSASDNGDNVPQRAVADPEFLIPRYADRLESVGWIGIKRCYDYTIEQNRPLFNDNTPRPQDYSQVKEMATPQRYERYQKQKSSDTMMDHYFDKLLHVSIFDERIVRNRYLVDESYRRYVPLLDFCVEFGRAGEVDLNWVQGVPIEGYK